MANLSPSISTSEHPEAQPYGKFFVRQISINAFELLSPIDVLCRAGDIPQERNV